MPQKASSNQTKIRQKIHLDALRLADKKPWDQVTFKDIARLAKVKITDIEKLYQGMNALGFALLDEVNAIHEKEKKPSFGRASTRDRLFEIIMERMDLLNDHRRAYSGIIHSLIKQPAHSGVCLLKASRMIVDRSGVDFNFIKTAGLSLILAEVISVWLGDDNTDMARTMARLDQRLGQAERAVNTLCRKFNDRP